MEEVTIRGLLRKIESLQNDVLNYQSQIETLNREIATLKDADTGVLSQLENKYNEYVEKCELLCESLKSNNSLDIQNAICQVNDIKQQMLDKVTGIDAHYIQRNSLLYDTVQSLIKRLDLIHIDIINNDENICITYTDHLGRSETGTILKVRSDEKTLTQDHTGVLSFKQKFDNNSFSIKDDVIYPTKLILQNGKYISSDFIENDLRNATSNVASLTRKFEALQKQISTSNGYVASNNFKTSQVDEQAITQFAIQCLSTSYATITEQQIPVGTKIKNTFDNHIWIYNKNPISGQKKWEDFGSDSICLANNEGVHGLVVGSNDRFRGHIDLQGVISINGLQEELESISQSLSSFGYIINEYDQKMTKIEQMLGIKHDDVDDQQ